MEGLTEVLVAIKVETSIKDLAPTIREEAALVVVDMVAMEKEVEGTADLLEMELATEARVEMATEILADMAEHIVDQVDPTLAVETMGVKGAPILTPTQAAPLMLCLDHPMAPQLAQC
jgi:hypothetical protein